MFNGSCGNLPSPCEVSIDVGCPDSLDNVGEHSNSANIGESNEVDKEHITVSMVSTKNNVPLHLPYIG